MKRILFLLLAAAALWACRPSAPLIGISCGRTSAGAASLSANYTEAVARAGGIPVIFPTVADSALGSHLLRRPGPGPVLLRRDGLERDGEGRYAPRRQRPDADAGGPGGQEAHHGHLPRRAVDECRPGRLVVPGYPDAGGYVRKARGRRLAPDRRGEGERAV